MGTINEDAFVGGKALSKLIELIGEDKKELVNRTDELTTTINKIREMFDGDELTECTWDELIGLANTGSLEPGHKYKIAGSVEFGDITPNNLIISAASKTNFEPVAIADDCLVFTDGYDIVGAIAYDDIVTKFSIGTVTTGAPGTDAIAEITGNSNDLKLNITIPQGPKGDQGDKGDTPELSIGTVTTAKMPAASINNDDPAHPVINLTMPEDAPYVSEAQDDWKTQAIGGIKGNQTPNNFEGKTISQMIDMLIYPTLQPSAPSGKPSVTLTYAGNNTSGTTTVIDITDTLLPVETAFTKVADRGTVAYTNAAGDKYYAGVVDDTKRVFSMTDNAWGQIPTEKRYTVTYSEYFTDGAKLLDNKGGDSTTANFKAATKTAYKYFDAVYPIYINTGSISTLAKQTAKDYIVSDQTYAVTIPAEPANSLQKFEFAVPEHLTVSSVLQKNPNNGKYEIVINMLDNGTTTYGGITYKKYIRSKSETDYKGSADYQITIKKKA